MKKGGFTLVELMVVVVVLGILAAIAIPAFVKYIVTSKTSEAKENLAYLYRQSTCYFAGENTDSAAPFVSVIPHQFPMSAGPNPAAPPPAKKTLTNWDAPTWQALTFALNDPHYFSYNYVSEGVGTTSSFSAQALGDLDGDGITSSYERQGKSNNELEVIGTRGIIEIDPLE